VGQHFHTDTAASGRPPRIRYRNAPALKTDGSFRNAAHADHASAGRFLQFVDHGVPSLHPAERRKSFCVAFSDHVFFFFQRSGVFSRQNNTSLCRKKGVFFEASDCLLFYNRFPASTMTEKRRDASAEQLSQMPPVETGKIQKQA
jgi:hypothetical protein